MVLLSLIVVSISPGQASGSPQAIKLKSGMVIAKSAKVTMAAYPLPNPDDTMEKPVVTVRGKGITVDFGGAALEGSPRTTEPDKRQGLGVLVEGENVTIKNLKIRGYKIGLLARNCVGLKLIDCDFSYNWKQHLMSNQEREDEADWMSYHQNDKNEWFRYGAGAYLEGCEKFEVKGLRVTGGQCGLMLTRSNKGLVWNSDLSFNSGLGLGMYRSSDNRIMNNKMDWCVRGYSHGVYNRGQDSAGILVFEQCSNNVFAYNSATHGGDGFFLWAGQHTMDTGEGGCNDNLLYGNDLSHSPANAIEATFSRNKFVNNKLIDSWHGVWGGYSYDTLIFNNVFAFNGESIAIEHGQNNRIAFNQFIGDTLGVFLWQNANPPDPNWGYPKNRDVRNVGTVVEHNAFEGIAETGILLGTGTNVTVRDNMFNQTLLAFKIDGTQTDTKLIKNSVLSEGQDPAVSGVTSEGNIWSGGEVTPPKPVNTRGGNAIVANEATGAAYVTQFNVPWLPDVNPRDIMEDLDPKIKEPGIQAVKELMKLYPKQLQGAKSAYLPVGTLRGRKYMLIGEWGPYDFRSPLLWPREKAGDSKLDGRRFEVLGPKGTWKLKSKSAGVVLEASSGAVPGFVTAKWPSNSTDIDIVLEYVGGATSDYRGVATAAGLPVKFGWNKSFIPIDWTVKFWTWDESRDPRTKYEEFVKWMSNAPIATYSATELSFASGGSPYKDVPGDHFATSAEGSFSSGDGDYALNVTSDDGVKVWLDGKLFVDEWHWQGPTLYTKVAKLTKGKHSLKIQHFEIDGYTALKVEVKPKR